MSRRRAGKYPGLPPSPETAAADVSRDNLKNELSAGIERQFDKLCAAPLAPGLHVVSTPIGNLSDITLRALFTLAAADIALCEDTRHSRKLFSAFGIGRKLETYHDFSSERDRERILGALRDGKSVALISDAGTPLVADPGFKLVRAALAEGVNVFPVPGASAMLSALVASGLPSDRFFFGGFLPAKEKARREALEALGDAPGALIFYESAARIEAALKAIASVFPARPAVLAREITKIHEGYARGTAQELLAEIERNPPIGELVLLIGPGEAPKTEDGDIEHALRRAMAAGSMKEAVEEVAKELGVAKKKVYNLALKLRDKQP
ncbi:MAG: 16S rRNA (cytidine(1402)-2'-O)-methyltransferase [Rhodomicrobium sp.]|jgi:16S rRNA (cytidine1402-2'-O)-methyltransferase